MTKVSVKAKAIKWYVNKVQWLSSKKDLKHMSPKDKTLFNCAVDAYTAGHRAGVKVKR